MCAQRRGRHAIMESGRAQDRAAVPAEHRHKKADALFTIGNIDPWDYYVQDHHREQIDSLGAEVWLNEAPEAISAALRTVLHGNSTVADDLDALADPAQRESVCRTIGEYCWSSQASAGDTASHDAALASDDAEHYPDDTTTDSGELLSEDGNYRWDGEKWVLIEHAPAADGRPAGVDDELDAYLAALMGAGSDDEVYKAFQTRGLLDSLVLEYN